MKLWVYIYWLRSTSTVIYSTLRWLHWHSTYPATLLQQDWETLHYTNPKSQVSSDDISIYFNSHWRCHGHSQSAFSGIPGQYGPHPPGDVIKVFHFVQLKFPHTSTAQWIRSFCYSVFQCSLKEPHSTQRFSPTVSHRAETCRDWKERNQRQALMALMGKWHDVIILWIHSSVRVKRCLDVSGWLCWQALTDCFERVNVTLWIATFTQDMTCNHIAKSVSLNTELAAYNYCLKHRL